LGNNNDMAGEKIIITAAEEVAETLAPGATRAVGQALVQGAKNILPEAAQRALGMEAAESAGALAGNELRSEFLQTGKQLTQSTTIAGVDTAQLSTKAQGYLKNLTPGERENILGPMMGSHPEDISELVEMIGPKLSSRNNFLPQVTFGELTGSAKVGEIGNTMNATEEVRRSLVSGVATPERVAARAWINEYMPTAMKQPPLSTVLPAEAGQPVAFGEGRYAVGKLNEALQTEHLETCAAISCVDVNAGRQMLLHVGDWNTAADISSLFKREGFDLTQSKVSIMLGPRASNTLENILPAFTDASGKIPPMKVIPSPPGMYPAAVSSYKGEFFIPSKLLLGD
jgi:hypothetical protein